MDYPIDTQNLPHDNRAHVFISVAVVVLSIATFSVALRIYTRAYLVGRIGLDDYLSMLALAAAIATGVSQCVNTRYGLGMHSWDLHGPSEVAKYSKNFYVNIALYNTGLGLVKLSFLAQYYRALVLRTFRITCVVAIILIGSWSVSQLLIGLFICRPIAGFWDTTLDAKCLPIPLQWYINAGGNIFTDVFIFILPLPVLAHLNLPKVQKYSLVAIFSLGFFTCAISVIRIKFLKQGGDFSYENIQASIWSLTELCSGVTCQCLPTLRPFVVKVIPKLSSKFQRPSSVCPLRQSGSRGSRAPNSGRGSKHSRRGSKEGTGGRSASEEEIHTRRTDTTLGTSNRTSEDASAGSTGPSSTRDSLYGGVPGFPRPLERARIAAQVRSRPNLHPTWLQSTVTTTISTGNRDSAALHDPSSTSIHATYEITMQDFTPP